MTGGGGGRRFNACPATDWTEPRPRSRVPPSVTKGSQSQGGSPAAHGADGRVRRAFTQTRTILSLFRELALGKTEPYDALCQLFDQETAQGKSMEASSRRNS